MKAIIFIAASLALVSAATYEDIFLKEWNLFKAQYGKTYVTPVDEYARMRIFLSNKHEVATHNLRFRSGDATYEIGINQFSDMLPEEVNNLYSGCDQDLPEFDFETFEAPNMTAPDTVNWVSKGAVNAVRNQGKCGSCYAFAALASLEGHQFIKNKKLVNLSPQNIVDCSSGFGNQGCNGGLAMNTFRYIQSNGGVNKESTYPYEGRQGKCRYNKDDPAGKCNGFVQVPRGNEDALKSATALGPVSVSIDASLKSFQQYKSGVFSDPQCSSERLGHAVLVVGYGTDPQTKKDYWLIKNSWDTTWGDRGYIKIARNAKNMCGVATRPVYPKL